MITSIISAVVLFGLLIIVHEAGHFFMAKRMGVRVLRFSVGYPPRIWGIRRGETDYCIGAAPLGGFVRMLGDEIAEEPSLETLERYLKEIELDLLGAARVSGWRKLHPGEDDEVLRAIVAQLLPAGGGTIDARQTLAILGRAPNAVETILIREIADMGSVQRAIEALSKMRPAALIENFNSRAFPSQRLAKRFAIVLAGPAANILFAPILMTLVFMVGVPTPLAVLGTIKTDMPAYAAGLRAGDRIVAVDGRPIAVWDDLSVSIRQSGGKRLDLEVQRPHDHAFQTLHLSITPKLTPEPNIFGSQTPIWVIGVLPRGDETTQGYPPLQAVRYGLIETGHVTQNLVIGYPKIITGATPARQALGGPIMIAQMAGTVVHKGFADAALFTVMLSLELGIINLLPVPLLDGGHLLFFVIEGLRGKPLKLRHRELAMEFGLFLLVILMFFVILNDISRIIG